MNVEVDPEEAPRELRRRGGGNIWSRHNEFIKSLTQSERDRINQVPLTRSEATDDEILAEIQTVLKGNWRPSTRVTATIPHPIQNLRIDDLLPCVQMLWEGNGEDATTVFNDFSCESLAGCQSASKLLMCTRGFFWAQSRLSIGGRSSSKTSYSTPKLNQ